MKTSLILYRKKEAKLAIVAKRKRDFKVTRNKLTIKGFAFFDDFIMSDLLKICKTQEVITIRTNRRHRRRVTLNSIGLLEAELELEFHSEK